MALNQQIDKNGMSQASLHECLYDLQAMVNSLKAEVNQLIADKADIPNTTATAITLDDITIVNSI